MQNSEPNFELGEEIVDAVIRAILEAPYGSQWHTEHERLITRCIIARAKLLGQIVPSWAEKGGFPPSNLVPPWQKK